MKEEPYNQQKTYHDHLSLKCELLKIQLVEEKKEKKKTLLLNAALAWFFL